LALLKSWRALERTRQGLKKTDPSVAEALKAIACATPPPRDATSRALRVTLRALRAQRGGIPWIYADRISAVDPATLEGLGAALADEAVTALLVVRTIEPSIPGGLRQIPRASTIELPGLDPAEALEVAATILGPQADVEVAKQAVVSGGLTVLGITEAARTMIATGDVVHDGFAFTFRDAEAERRQFLGPRALLEERFATLDTSSMRFLEIACASLPASSAQVIDVAVGLDGIAEDTRRRAFDALINDGLLTSQGKPTSELLRRAVVQRMPPARRTEVYRFVAQALHSAEPLVGPSMAATVGAYLCEGGELERGARAILQAGSLAAANGYTRAAVRLAAAAVQYQPDRRTRSAASEISKAVRLPSGPPIEELEDRPTVPLVEAELENPAAELVRSLKARDHARFDALIDAAIAAGGDLIGAHCLRVFSYVARQDLAAAKEALDAAVGSPRQSPAADIRISIASACLHLAHGRGRDGMIDALQALAAARSRRDGPAEAAALKMVSVTCLAAGLPMDADRLAHAAGAVAS
jgi:hypothetical protein